MIFLLAVFFLMNATSFAADETPKKESGIRCVGMVLGRGAVNLVTLPGEIVRTVPSEREMHPKLWPVTYLPRMFLNLAVRLVSSVNDIGILPWYVGATKDTRPITNFYDLPDYVWQKL